MNTPVSFELAKLLKEKGFDIPTSSFYFKNGTKGGEHSSFNWNEKDSFNCSAPTIAEVVMWLYEKHGIWVNVTISQEDGWEYIIGNTITFDGLGYKSLFNSPTEAYEAGIEYCLTKLKLDV